MLKCRVPKLRHKNPLQPRNLARYRRQRGSSTPRHHQHLSSKGNERRSKLIQTIRGPTLQTACRSNHETQHNVVAYNSSCSCQGWYLSAQFFSWHSALCRTVSLFQIKTLFTGIPTVDCWTHGITTNNNYCNREPRAKLVELNWLKSLFFSSFNFLVFLFHKRTTGSFAARRAKIDVVKGAHKKYTLLQKAVVRLLLY